MIICRNKGITGRTSWAVHDDGRHPLAVFKTEGAAIEYIVQRERQAARANELRAWINALRAIADLERRDAEHDGAPSDALWDARAAFKFDALADFLASLSPPEAA